MIVQDTLEDLKVAEQRTAHAANEMLAELDDFMLNHLSPRNMPEYREITKDLRDCLLKWEAASHIFLSTPYTEH